MPAPPALPTPFPDAAVLTGREVELRRIDLASHAEGLWRAIGQHPGLWDSIPGGPFDTQADMARWLDVGAQNPEVVIHTIIDRTGGADRIGGVFYLVQIATPVGRCEIGLVYGPEFQRTRAATEAFFVLARYVLGELGYRRFEWRCRPENAASMRAAARYGFTHEGTLRQQMWLKGENWDTAVHAILDHEWPDIARRFEAWLDPANFDAAGRQLTQLNPG